MRRPRSAAAVHAFAAVLLVSSCCLGFHAAPRAQERTSQERAPDFYVQTPWDARSVDLAKLYDTYRSKRLEIVALDFEYPDQIKDPERLRAVIPMEEP